jgi:hypothetical protein
MLRCHKLNIYLLRNSRLTLRGVPAQAFALHKKAALEALPPDQAQRLLTGVALDLSLRCSLYA